MAAGLSGSGLYLPHLGYDAAWSTGSRALPYTIGIEEELMIVDAETLDLANSIEGAARGPRRRRTEGEVKPELMESVCEIATDALPQHGARPATSCARCGGA